VRARAQLRIERQLVAMAQEQSTTDKRKAERLALENHHLRRSNGQLTSALDLRHEEAARLLTETEDVTQRTRRLEVQVADLRTKNGRLETEVRHYRSGWIGGGLFEECPSLPEPVNVPPTHPMDEGRADPWVICGCCEVVVMFTALLLNSRPLAWLGLGLVVLTVVLAGVGTWKNRSHIDG
jgi:hypothetical protein